MKLTPHISLVGSGRMGFGISHELDCHVYLLDGGGELALLDAGCGIEPERIVANIETDGHDPSTITKLLLTHAHADHSGGSRFWHDTFGVEVHCSSKSAGFLKHGNEEGISLDVARKAGMYPEGFPFQACSVAGGLKEGDTLTVGNLIISVMETPGHADDAVCYRFSLDDKECLASGDLIFFGGKIALLSTHDCCIPDYSASIRRLAGQKIDALLPGHLVIPLSGAQTHIEKAALKFRLLGVPEGIA
ncbi:MAG: MBL fold metallo-hydrolase [Armatimonadetes bacterium]|nr:MBL fold metallo-hydrolase [Armatimonadota bacterium]